jgi:hypothetical protein
VDNFWDLPFVTRDPKAAALVDIAGIMQGGQNCRALACCINVSYPIPHLTFH